MPGILDISRRDTRLTTGGNPRCESLLERSRQRPLHKIFGKAPATPMRDAAGEIFRMVPRLTHLARNGTPEGAAAWVCSRLPVNPGYGFGRLERCAFGPARVTGTGRLTAPEFELTGTAPDDLREEAFAIACQRGAALGESCHRGCEAPRYGDKNEPRRLCSAGCGSRLAHDAPVGTRGRSASVWDGQFTAPHPHPTGTPRRPRGRRGKRRMARARGRSAQPQPREMPGAVERA